MEPRVERWDTPLGRLAVNVRNPDADEAILLIAGQTESVQVLDRLADYLSGDRAVYQLELPGRGKSSGVPNYSNDVGAIIIAAERIRSMHERVYGFGHSLGSVELLVASKLAGFDKLVASGHPIIMQDWMTKIYGFAGRNVPDALRFGASVVERLRGHETSRFGAIRLEDLPAAMASYLDAPNLDELLPVATPTLFIYGGNDRFSPLQVRARIKKRIDEPHAWAVLRNRNHSLGLRRGEQWGERDNAAKQIIDQWLASA